MRILVSGSTGIIGHAVMKTLATNHDVWTLGRRPDSTLQADFSHPASLEALDLRGVDVVVHCAGVRDEDFKASPSSAYRMVYEAHRTLVDKAVQAQCRGFVYFSTMHVFGAPEGVVDESKCPSPISDYGIAHYSAERILHRASSAGKLKSLVLRPNAIYGLPGDLARFERWSLIPYSFPREALTRGHIQLLTSGEQPRNFLGSSDLARYVEHFVESMDEYGSSEVRHPVSPETLSVYEFAQLCALECAEYSGRPCTVGRLPPSAEARDAGYRFATRYASPRSDQNVRNHIREMFSALSQQSL